MKSILTSTFLFLASVTLAHANDIDVLVFTPPGGTVHNASLNVINNGDNIFSAETINLADCSAAAGYLANTTKPTVAIWSVPHYSVSNNKACDILDQTNFVTVYSQAYYSICTLTDKAQTNTLEKIRTGDAKIGTFNHIVEITQIENIAQSLGGNAKIVPYTATPDMLAALEIGEVDFLYTARVSDKMTCVATADLYSESSVPKLVDLIDTTFATSNFTLLVIGKNVDKEQVRNAVLTAVNSEEWKTKFPFHRSETTQLPIDIQYQLIDDMVVEIKKKIE